MWMWGSWRPAGRWERMWLGPRRQQWHWWEAVRFRIYFETYLTGNTDRLDLECERKRWVKDDLKFFGLSNWKIDIPFTWKNHQEVVGGGQAGSHGGNVLVRGLNELSGVMEICLILSGGCWVYTVKTQWSEYLISLHFILRKLYLNTHTAAPLPPLPPEMTIYW